MSYWNRTDRILKEKGAPDCPHCGEKMFPIDDHGRFDCLCTNKTPKILQVKAENLSDEEKAKISPLHRLNMSPTKAEAEFLRIGPPFNFKEIKKASEKIRKERIRAQKKKKKQK